ncbi:MAG: GH116 family glycosyl hydrolase [Bacillota bacterium]
MSYKNVIERNNKVRSGLQHGGIGTGGIELRADGIFGNFGIFNNQPLGTGKKYAFPDHTSLFFKVRWQEKGEQPKMKLLQIEEGPGLITGGVQPFYYIFPWMSGVDKIEYSASFPFSNLKYSDEEMPFDIEMEVVSPFIPHDVKNSSLPGIYFNFNIIQKGETECDVMLMLIARNGVGYDVKQKEYSSETGKIEEFCFVEMACKNMLGTEASFGTQTIASISSEASYYAGWEHLHPYYEYVLRNPVLPDINVTEDRNAFNKDLNLNIAGERLFSTVAVSKKIKDKQSFKHTFLYTWNFPNFYSDKQEEGSVGSGKNESHYYANFFDKSIDVAKYMLQNLKELQFKTREFHNNYFESSVPVFVLDQINSHLNTFITSSILSKSKNFGISEGMLSDSSVGPFATMDVGMYGSVMPASLFPEIDKMTFLSHRDAQLSSGEVIHGLQRNFKSEVHHEESVQSRIDMPSQFVIQSLRDYFWTNDKEFLKEVWPAVVKTIEYCLNQRDADGDSIPDMEGVMCSYDNFPMYGVASYIASQWLSALQFASLAAKDLGENELSVKYNDLFKVAQKNAESRLWNGEYFRLCNDEGGKSGIVDEGCLTDQIIGQWAKHMIGSEDIFDKEKMHKALKFICNNSSKEYGIVNCRWPQDEYLHDVDDNCWNDQANTCWTGVELEFAALLIFEGMLLEGLAVIKNVDDRHRKNGMYFDHPEFGGHYYRPLSSWSIINAMLGLSIRGTELYFAPKLNEQKARYFFVLSNATAHFTIDTHSKTVEITVNTGSFNVSKINLTLPNGEKIVELYDNKNVSAGEVLTIKF